VFDEQPVCTYVVTIGAFDVDSLLGIPRFDSSFIITPSCGDAQYFTIDTSTTLIETAGIIRTAMSMIFDRGMQLAVRKRSSCFLSPM